MIVEPTFFDHWKTKMLEPLLGVQAPLYVLRLWGYCQDRREWEFHNIPDGGIAAICRFDGEPAELLKALSDVRFIELDNGVMRVRNWHEYNASLVAAWTNGSKGGRPRKITQQKPVENPSKTQAKPKQNPPETACEPIENPQQTHNKPTGNRLDKTRVEEKKKGKKKSATAPRTFMEKWESEACADLRDSDEWDALREACLNFIEHRESMRPPAKMTPRSLDMLLRDIRKVDPAVAVALLDDAVRNGTRGWYWPDKAERFTAKLASSISPPANAGDDFAWEPADPSAADTGPDPWKI